MKSDETQWMITGRKLDKTGRKSAQMKQKSVLDETQMQNIVFLLFDKTGSTSGLRSSNIAI